MYLRQESVNTVLRSASHFIRLLLHFTTKPHLTDRIRTKSLDKAHFIWYTYNKGRYITKRGVVVGLTNLKERVYQLKTSLPFNCLSPLHLRNNSMDTKTLDDVVNTLQLESE